MLLGSEFVWVWKLFFQQVGPGFEIADGIGTGVMGNAQGVCAHSAANLGVAESLDGLNVRSVQAEGQQLFDDGVDLETRLATVFQCLLSPVSFSSQGGFMDLFGRFVGDGLREMSAVAHPEI